MIHNTKRFFFIATGILFLLIALSQIFFFTFFETKNFPLRIMGIVFVWLVTCSSYFWVMKTVTNKPRAFSRVFMLQTTIRLMLYMMCILIYLVVYKQHGVAFTVHFLVVYLVFAVFEVASILKFVKNNTGQMPGDVKKSN